MELIDWIIRLLPASVHAQKIISGALEAIIISRFVAGIVFPFAALLFELVMHAPREIVGNQVPFAIDFQSCEFQKMQAPLHGIAVGAGGMLDESSGRVDAPQDPLMWRGIWIIIFIADPGVIVSRDEPVGERNSSRPTRTAIALSLIHI